MVQKIKWLPKAEFTFLQTLDYLETHFTQAEAVKFADRIQSKLFLIQSNPRIGNPTKKKPNVYKTVIHKRIVLLYLYKPLKKEILLLEFWNTLQSPDKLKF